jgi:hypothetical protein
MLLFRFALHGFDNVDSFIATENLSAAVFVNLEDFRRGQLDGGLASNLTPHAKGSLRFLKDLLTV